MSNSNAIPENLLRRLQALQTLADHAASDPNEAAAAAQRVQALLTRYRIDPAALEAATGNEAREPEGVEVRIVWESGRPSMPTWVGLLGYAVAKSNGCYDYRGWDGAGKRTFKMVGTPLRLSGAAYVLTWLTNEVNRLAKSASKAGVVRGTTALNNYRLGVVQTLAERLEKAAASERDAMWSEASDSREADNGAALMRLDRLAEVQKAEDRAISDKVGTLGLKNTWTRMRSDHAAKAAGRQAGRSVNLGSGRGAPGSGLW